MKEWTIMVYMAADNNLNVEMAYALEQLKEAAQRNDLINLYVYYDGLSSDVPTLYCDFSNRAAAAGSDVPINFYQSYKIQNKLIDVDADFNENSAAVSNIINFVDWCVKKDTPEQIKNKKYAFIFSGHSFGFLNWGLFKDEKADSHMSHSELKSLFERITDDEEALLDKAAKDEDEYKKTFGKTWTERERAERTTPILGKSLDLLGFDSCVMSTLEVGCQFRKFAKTMVASEGSIPTAGWNYAQILLDKIKNPNSEAKEIAVSFVDQFIKQQNKFALADISVDISAWDLQCLPALERSFTELVENLFECFDQKNPTIYNQMRRLLTFAHWQSQTYMFEQHIDLGDFCQLLVSEIELLKSELAAEDLTPVVKVGRSCKKVIEKIRDCVLLTGFSGGDFQFSTGISLFFPWSLASYLSARQDYENLTFITKNSAGIKWNEFLQLYLGEVSMRKALPLTQTDESGNTISATVIYESYANMDDPLTAFSEAATEGRQPPNSGRQPPNSGRQPPNSGRQPPNSGRMIGDLNLFLSRFMRLKNFQFNWNRSGFTSKNVKFRQTAETAKPGVSNSAISRIIVDIPKPRSINKQIEEFFRKLDELKQHRVENVNITGYAELFEEIVRNSDEPTLVEILGDLSKSLESDGAKETELKATLENAFAKSLSAVRDTKIKVAMTKNFDKINFRS